MAMCSSGKCCDAQQPEPFINEVNNTSKTHSLRYQWFIRGMDCGGCATKIEKALRSLPGVRQVKVAYATERLLISLDNAQTVDKVQAIVRQLGFTLQDNASGASEKPLWQSHFSFVLLACLTVLASSLSFFFPPVGHHAFTLAVIAGIIPFAKKAIGQIKNGSWFGMETLITLAALGALLLGETVEGVLVLLLFSLGEMLEGLAGHKAKTGIKSLMQLTPEHAIKITANECEEIPAELLAVGDDIEVRPGDRLPVDGIVKSVSGLFNESALTGESMPAFRAQGQTVMAGSLVVDQPVCLSVTSEPGHNAIDRIITLIEEAENNRAPIARMIDKFSAWYTPLIMIMAILVMVTPPLLFGVDIQSSAYKALTLLLIACPCALVISIPAAVTSALASAARFGALIKGGASLEQLRLIKTLAFDKTGTLTAGNPKVTAIIAVEESEAELLAWAAAIEQSSNHPLAKAITHEAKARELTIPDVTDAKVLVGQGVQGKIDHQLITLLSPRHAVQEHITGKMLEQIAQLEHNGNTVVVMQSEHRTLGLIGLADTLRSDAIEAVEKIKQLGINVVMLTGDNQRAAAAIAGKLGIKYQAELLPEGKVAAIKTLQQKNQGIVAMVGDGINDAPALKTAELGIAMGCGSDIALESADAALTHERLTELAAMIKLSKNTIKITRQNIILALSINTFFLLTTLLGITGLMGAVLSDTGGSVLITLNALRLMRSSAYH